MASGPGVPPEAADLRTYLATAVPDPTSALLVSGERAIAAEFPPDALPRRVLGAVGAGERTFTAIRRAAGDIQQASLNRALQILLTTRVVVTERPLSTRASRETRYRVADPYLRFWLAYLAPGLAEIERGRGDVVHSRIRSGWTSWRGGRRVLDPVQRPRGGRGDRRSQPCRRPRPGDRFDHVARAAALRPP